MAVRLPVTVYTPASAGALVRVRRSDDSTAAIIFTSDSATSALTQPLEVAAGSSTTFYVDGPSTYYVSATVGESETEMAGGYGSRRRIECEGGRTVVRVDAPPTTSGGGVPLFGTGADGAGTITEDTTLTADMYYTDLTVDSAITLTTAGYRVYVSGTLTLNGTIANNGAAAVADVAGAAAPGVTIGAGAAGGAGGGTTGTAGTSTTVSLGEVGGAGGAGTGGAGGAATTAADPSAETGGVKCFRLLTAALEGRARLLASTVAPTGGAGGSGGGGNTTTKGGGGGGGGGGVLVAAKALAGAGSIFAKGGAGAAGEATLCGGGGGGGGGWIVLISRSSANPYTLSVAGGSGGASGGSTGVAGTAGTAGRTFVHLGV